MYRNYLNLSDISNVFTVRERLVQLGCHFISKSLTYNNYTGKLMQGSVSSITRDRNSKTVHCMLFPYIAFSFACQVFVYFTLLT